MSQSLLHIFAAIGCLRSDVLIDLRGSNVNIDDAFWRIVLGLSGAEEAIRRACVHFGHVPENASVEDALAAFDADRAPKLVFKTQRLEFRRFLPVVVGENEPVPEIFRDWIAAGQHRERMDAGEQAWLEAWLEAHRGQS